MARLNWPTVRAMRAYARSTGKGSTYVSRHFDVSLSHTKRILSGENWIEPKSR